MKVPTADSMAHAITATVPATFMFMMIECVCVAEKVEIANAAIKSELELLPQGDAVPKDAQDFKDELKRINDYVVDLNKRVMTECEHFSEDVKYWAEFKTGVRGFK